MPDDNPDAFKIVLAHCYEVTISPSDIHEAMEVYMLADKYFLEELSNECLNYILKKLYTSIVIESHIYALNVAFGLKYPRLSRDTVRYIQGGLVVAGTGLHRWPSNGIFYVVNLKEAHFYQKCHDTECYGFRSAAQ